VAIKGTNFELPGQVSFYKGKVRDVYNIDNKLLVMVATDRISAFDVVLPKPIPYKGQVLNQLAAKFLASTQDILPNWILSAPDENVSIGRICVPFKVEMVIRGYLVGHAWRTYKSGERMLCGVKMPDGMIENQAFEKPIITPTTKASEGHDEDISREEIIKKGIVSEADYLKIEAFTRKIYQTWARNGSRKRIDFGRYEI
jgi:phosphoribosylaminoimidazole-succinocarboxamide synthase